MSHHDLEASSPLNSSQEDPTRAIASGIFQINTSVSTFQRLVNALGTPKDTPELRERLHKTRQHIGQLVKDTSDKLKQASETNHHAKVRFWRFKRRAKKTVDSKLAKDFQAVLKEFQKAQRLADERETAYAPFLSQSVLPSSYSYAASEMDISSNKSLEHVLVDSSRRQEDLSLESEIAFNYAIIEEREQGIQELHNQIDEVNEILKDLVILVHEQRLTMDDIGYNIENSHAATAHARSRLLKASKTQRANFSMSCLLLVIVGIVLCIVIIIIVVKP